MQRKRIAAIGIISCMLILAACGKNDIKNTTVSDAKTNSENGQVTEVTGREDASNQDGDNTQYEYPSEETGNVTQTSPFGYVMTYDPTVFTLDDTTTDTETYIYNTAEKLDAPVYLSVQNYADMDAKTLADGLALQSGIDGVNVEEANFGADGIETYSIYYEQEENEVKQVYVFYAIPKGQGTLLVEIMSYVGVPETVDGKFEEMLGTFALVKE